MSPDSGYQVLVAGNKAPEKATWKSFNPSDRRVVLVHRLLLLALRRMGPNRYEVLMRYVAYLSVLRNQSVFLDGKSSISSDAAARGRV